MAPLKHITDILIVSTLTNIPQNVRNCQWMSAQFDITYNFVTFLMVLAFPLEHPKTSNMGVHCGIVEKSGKLSKEIENKECEKLFVSVCEW